MDGREKGGAAAVAFEHVSKRFGDANAVDDVNLAIAEGMFVTIIGSSGCGKTTLLKMVNALVMPDEGEVLVHGRATSNADPIGLRRNIGYAIQGSVLFPHLTVEQNIAYVPTLLNSGDEDRTEAAVKKWMDIIGLPRDIMDRYPAEPEPELGGTPRDYMGKVLAYCQRYANSFTPESRGLMFIGSAGLGKTHMALAIADTVLNRGFDVLYTSSAALAAQLGREHFDRAAEDPWLDACKEADLLILDDLGTEYISQLTISVLYELINTRMLCHRPTIYTSNIVDSSIFEARYTEKVASRILGSCQIFKFFGTDQRLKRGGKR